MTALLIGILMITVPLYLATRFVFSDKDDE